MEKMSQFRIISDKSYFHFMQYGIVDIGLMLISPDINFSSSFYVGTKWDDIVLTEISALIHFKHLSYQL